MIHMHLHQPPAILKLEPESLFFHDPGEVAVINQCAAQLWPRVSTNPVVDSPADQNVLSIGNGYRTQGIIDLFGRIQHADAKVSHRHHHPPPEIGQHLFCAQGEQIEALVHRQCQATAQ